MKASTRRLAFSALTALGLALAVHVPSVTAGGGKPAAAPKAEPRWAKSWELAMEEAKERNVPIYITFHQDG